MRITMTPAMRVGLSVAIATGLYGVSFGALGVAAGLDVLQVVALSALMFTGGSQFGAATLLGVRNAVAAAWGWAGGRPR